jgi:hypothetical protein
MCLSESTRRLSVAVRLLQLSKLGSGTAKRLCLKARVASTLGKQVHILLNPERVAPVGRNRVAVELVIQFCKATEAFPNVLLHFQIEFAIHK